MNMIKFVPLRFPLAALPLLFAACGSDDDDARGDVGDACAHADGSDCDAGLSCDPRVDGSGYVCGEPAVIRGRVLDALSSDAVTGGRVVVLGADGSPVGDVAFTDAAGRYSSVVAALREMDGSVAAAAQWTLAVSAQGYEGFPAGPRPALPISGTQLTSGGVIDAPNTEVGLLPLAHPEQFSRQISGTIAAPTPGATLVVAEGGPAPAPHGISGRSGEFTIFNVPAAELEIVGYKRGLQLERSPADAREASLSDVVLAASEAPLGSLSGNVNIVNAPGGSQTSVVLVPQSVFDPRLERGPIPFGLRAPGPPESPNISGEFAFDQVPNGDYVVLAAFENDALVRDPDAAIAGTTIQTVTIDSDQSIAMSQSFKITEHLAIVAPGAEAPERVSGPITFSWADDSSEDRYELELYTAMGDLVWEQRAILAGHGSSTVQLPYAGPGLTPGMVYQFRVASFRDRNGVTTAISRSEDLRGVFEYRP